jgi:polar amino acid transport system permease protein
MTDSGVMPLDLLPPLLGGLAVSLQITAGAAGVALVMSLVAGLARLAPGAVVRAMAATYIEVFRGTSALVQLFWAFFVLPFLGIDLSPMAAGILVLGLNTGAYGAEAVRGVLRSIPADQWDAAAALSLSRSQTMRWIVLPQAAPVLMGPATNLLIELLKATALVSLISIADLTFVAQTLRADTLRTAEIFTLTLLLYFLAALVVSRGMRRVERHLARWRDAQPA